MGGSLNKVPDSVKDNVEHVKDAAHGTIDKVAEVATPTIEKLSDTAHTVVDKASTIAEAVAPTIDKLSDTAQTVVDKVSSGASQAKTMMSEKTSQLKDPENNALAAALLWTRENPVTAVAIAAGAGYIFGRKRHR
jgi:ElaB/YqjD/DUF883 family membrane-anchored ribosome-binding protein